MILGALLESLLLPNPTAAPFVGFFPCLAVAMWFSGLGAGICAALLSAAVGNFLFVEPRWAWSLSWQGLAPTLLFAAVAVFVAVLCDVCRGAIHKLRQVGTEQRKVEEILRRREATVEQAAEMAHLGAWTVDVASEDDIRSNPLEWCDEVYRIFGIEPGSLVITHEDFYRMIHPDDRQRVADAVSQAIAEKRAYNVAHRIVRPDGVQRVVQEHADLEFDAQGRLRRMIGAVQDVTERTRAEEALREADRRKNEFLAVLSHELRNPLAPIRNSLYVLEHAAPGSAQAERARQIIDRQTRQMTRLVDDLLDVTRISRGKITLQREAVDLGALVVATAEDHRESFSRNGLDLRVEPPGGPLWVDGDRTRLAQIVGNLLQNAVKFTPRGGTVVLSVAAGERGDAVVRVRDSGVGMSPETVQHVFEPFAQASQSIDRSRGGLGLGLALVRGLVETHGGTVTAHSEGEGRGSEFVVTVPLQAPVPAPSASMASPAVAAGRRVLIVEDNVDAAESLREALLLGQHEVAVAYTGPEAIEAARRFRPDAIICDIGLPGMDGYGVAQALRADCDDVVRAAYLVALSGYARPEDVSRSKEAGFDRHLAKPPNMQAIERLLAEAPLRYGAAASEALSEGRLS